MVDIDIVYANLEPRTVRSFRRGDVRVSWTPVPLREAALHAYQGAYSFLGETGAIEALMQSEPVVVLPREYTFEVTDRFDYVFTLVDALVDLDAKFRKWNHVAYSRQGRAEEPATPSERLELYPIEGRRSGSCMILGNKTSDVPGEIYSLREPIARWFNEHSAGGLDVYGMPGFEGLPNYRGKLPAGANQRKMSEYRYCICFENAHDAFWTAGVFSERLIHCIESRTVPVYYGCSNIERYVPTDCYVDYREFEEFGELSRYLDEMPDAEYVGYIEAMDRWYESADLPAYHANDLYNRLTGLYSEATSTPLHDLYAGEDMWTPTHVDGLTPIIEIGPDSVVLPLDTKTRYQWRWQYLTDGSVEEADATVAAMRDGGHVPHGCRQPSSPVATQRKPRTIERVLVVGRVSATPPLPAEGEFTKYHLLSAWMHVPGVELDLMDSDDIIGRAGAAGFSQRLHDKVRRERPDLLFYVPTAPIYDVQLEALGEITANTDTRTMIWAGMTPEYLDDVSDEWPRYVDYVVAPVGSLARRYEAAGHGNAVIESRWAYNPASMRPFRVPREDRISFGGEYNAVRGQVAAEIHEASLPVHPFGFGWEPQGPLPFEDLVGECSRSAINLSVLSRRRPFEVTGAGGFLMTTMVEEIQGAFVTDEDGASAGGPNGAEIVVVRDTSEIVDKARYYLRNASARESIGRRGHERALREHTWEARFRDVIGKAGWRLPTP